MAARSILNFVYVVNHVGFFGHIATFNADTRDRAIFPNLDYDFTVTSNDFATVDPSLSYYDHISGDSIVTLSTNSAVPSPIQGLLYVPDLDPEDDCWNVSSQYIPANVTRQSNLPSTDYNIIAIAPWIDTRCTRSFLASANLDPIRAFIFYYPDNETTLPLSNESASAIWSLEDGGTWKKLYRWPVYGVSGAIGQRMMAESSKYSGNMTTVPNGRNLSTRYDTRDFVRIYTQITTNDTTSLPTLWIFLLVIFACLIVILTFISLSMHLVQRRRRDSLRRRVANGEVDLEALGIKRLTVPKEFVDKLPLYVYTCNDRALHIPPPSVARLSLKNDAIHNIQEVDSSGHDLNSHPPLSSLPPFEGVSPIPLASNESALIPHQYQPDYQPTCPICSDEFESSITAIRELPCGHIYHPECIDSFLTINSSLCPLCKKSVLPFGYCPIIITNAMVRREFMVSRIRSRVNIEIESDSLTLEALRRRILRFGQSIFRLRPVALQPDYQLRERESGNSSSQALAQNLSPQVSNSHILQLEDSRHRVPESVIREPGEENVVAQNGIQVPQWRKAMAISAAKVFPGYG